MSEVVLWGSARDDVWAVGDAGLILHFDGATWTRVPGISRGHLFAITGTARDDVWVFGFAVPYRDGRVAALHWDGSAWTDHPIESHSAPSAAGVTEDGRVWAASSDGAWVWNGSSWDTMLTAVCKRPAGARGHHGCAGVASHSAGGGTVMPVPGAGLFDGAVVPDLPPAGRAGGSRPSNIWGGSGTVLRWQHSRWEKLPVPGPTLIHGFHGTADDDVWLAGDEGAIFHWDGSEMTRLASRADGDLSAVWASASDDVWFAGPGGLLHWDGKQLVTTTTSLTAVDLLDVWGADACDLWAVGKEGIALHRNCHTWTVVPTPSTATVHGVGGSARDDVWLVGDGGVIMHWDGRVVSRVESPTTSSLVGVWAASAKDAWAVGDHGTTLHWDGRAWTGETRTDELPLRRVDGDRPSHAVAVGARILEWDGRRWSEVARRGHDCPAYVGGWHYTGVAFVAGHPVVTCNGGGAMVLEGGTWRDAHVELGYVEDIASTGTRALVADHYGAVATHDGGGWHEEGTPTSLPLHAAWISPDGAMWVVGDHGTIISHRSPHTKPLVP